ncbi:sporulation protein YqfD [Paenactinomyces guangxiensis]|uniref:Sporulation protein YqfD n=1 Tax=Paenactinomyces guangxiensis TaxID=1490290 RepID=A0A7W1WNN4_9BACL|nr:sporulation protein YqfD [Paenactinomyces guangxiensis]MBA4493155.1 sporulation protein YqfD [Paenactinomyces guangxiensis]MBH8589995.1 sporulation protein YqfD [Paenactinomyces guangxiensis]
MLEIQWPNILKGKLELECYGPNLASFLNQTVQAGIWVENIHWVDEGKIKFTILVHDFFRLVALMRRNKIRMRIVRKAGVPFLVNRVKRRKAFLLGIILFFFLIFLMSSFVWKIQIVGTERIPEKHVRTLLQKEGVFFGQLKARLPESKQVQYYLLSRLPQASWVGFRIEGTRVIVTVVEKKGIESTPEAEDGYGPVDLVSRKDALVYDMRVEQGNPLVEVNDMVKKGDVLVSGKYGVPDDPESGTIVGAKGKVLGEVWYESEVVVPTVQKRKVYTGFREKATAVYLGRTVLRNPFGNELPYKQYETVQKVKSIQFGTWRLPFGWVEIEYLEMKWIQKKLTEQEAANLGKRQAKEELLQKLGRDGRILEEKVLHQREENGKVYLKVHFDAIENIAVPQPILQGE